MTKIAIVIVNTNCFVEVIEIPHNNDYTNTVCTQTQNQNTAFNNVERSARTEKH